MVGISGFDYAVALLAIAAATVFSVLRRRLKAPNPPDQWLSDVFNVGTLVILADLMLLPLTTAPRVLPAPWGETMREAAGANGLVVLAAFGNCIRVIAAGMWRSFSAEGVGPGA